MADDAGTIERIAQAIASALAPLQQQLSAGQAAAFLNSLGLALPPGLPADAQLGSALATLWVWRGPAPGDFGASLS